MGERSGRTRRGQGSGRGAWWLWAALCCVVALGAVGCSGAPVVPRAPIAGEAHVAVATYNVNYGLAGDRDTLDAMVATDADVLFVQESTPAWERVLRAELGERYPHMAFFHSRGAGGLAVLSRLPFEERERVEGVGGWFPAWRVVVESPLGPLQVLQVHLRPPISDGGSWVWGYLTSDGIHEAELTKFLGALDPELPTMVVGDFNEEPGGAALELLEARGMRNALPRFDPDAPTWRWPTSVMELEATLDHIVYSDTLEVIEARALRAGRSDHVPVVARVVRKRRAAPVSKPEPSSLSGASL